MKIAGDSEQTWIPVLCLLLYVCSSMIGLLTIPWTMTAELFPSEIRGVAHSISYSMANFLMFIAVRSYRDLSAALGGAYAIQFFFAAVSMIGFLFGLVFLPETHGKKLSEIEQFFASKTKPKAPVRTKAAATAATNNRKPKQKLETVKEAEKMIKPSDVV